MSITFHFRPKVKTVICVHAGMTPDDEFLASYKSLFANDLYDTSMHCIIDLRQVDNPQISIDSLHQLAKFVRDQKPPHKSDAKPKMAVIAPRDNLFDLTLKYEVFTKDLPRDFVIFRSEGAALAWLDLPKNFLDSFNKDAQQ